MTRKVFFSFHYQRDYWRVNQVRNSWVTKGESNAFMDAASWEKIKRKGVRSIKNWIDDQLKGTSVTIVLIGIETANRKYVDYEIEKSCKRGNGLLGIYIDSLKDQNGATEFWQGRNPFSNFTTKEGFMFDTKLSDIVPTYDWVDDNGYSNIDRWIEKAVKAAGRKK